MGLLATTDRGAQLNGPPLAGECLGEPHAVAAGLADVGVVQESVDGGGSQRLGHQLVEPGRVQVRADRDRPFLVGGVDEPVEPLGCVRGDGQQADVVDLCGYPHRSTRSATYRSSKTPRTCSSNSSAAATNTPR